VQPLRRDHRAGDVGMSATATVETPRLREKYEHEIAPELLQEFDYSNVMQVPRVEKVVVNIGIGEAITDGKAIDHASNDLRLITGQQPIVLKAKRSVAAFRLREGMPVGLKVTLRGPRMWYFLDKLVSVALPRIRDFRGVPEKAFDGHGNYTLGLREQLIFPEIDYDQIDKTRGMEITIVTSAKTDDEAMSLLARLGMPFRQKETDG
jgi:large subunit ribosomal protein L5